MNRNTYPTIPSYLSANRGVRVLPSRCFVAKRRRGNAYGETPVW